MTNASPLPAGSRTVLYAEQEHGGIRMAVFLSLFASYALGWLLISWLIRTYASPLVTGYATFLACVGAVPLALLVIWLIERTLKNVWHSGLSLQLDSSGIYVENIREGGKALAPNDPPFIDWSKTFNQLNWYFRLSGYPRGGRERRVSEKWLCLCTELQQDEYRLSIYAFMPPETAEQWIGKPNSPDSFHIIDPGEIYDTGIRSRMGPPMRPTIPTSLLHSKDGRYWLAERRRWEMGIELTADDFATIMSESKTAMAADPEPASTTATGTAPTAAPAAAPNRSAPTQL